MTEFIPELNRVDCSAYIASSERSKKKKTNMAVAQAPFVPAGRQAIARAEQITFADALQIGDEVHLEWNSSAHTAIALWKGTVLVKGEHMATVSWFEPAGLPPTAYPPTHACNILRQTKVAISADPWAEAAGRTGQAGSPGPVFTDPLTWGLVLDGTVAEKAAKLFQFSSWIRGFHCVPDKSLTQDASRDVHEKNLIILMIEQWVGFLFGKPDWRDPEALKLLELALFRLMQMRVCKDAAEMKKFALKFEGLGIQSNNRLSKATKNWRASGTDGRD